MITATVVFIFFGTSIPDKWWEVLLIVIGAFFGGRRPETVADSADTLAVSTSTASTNKESGIIRE
jgi:hypothetical protein